MERVTLVPLAQLPVFLRNIFGEAIKTGDSIVY
jgi:hypothetical protein